MGQENKYKEGETVYELANPSIKLVVRRYVSSIYYCAVLESPRQRDHVFFEKELTR